MGECTKRDLVQRRRFLKTFQMPSVLLEDLNGSNIEVTVDVEIKQLKLKHRDCYVSI